MAWQLFSVLAAVLLATVVNGCSDVGAIPTTTVERVYHHDIVLHGRVTATTPDPTFPRAYSVDMTVQCAIKSNVDIGESVNIKQAGGYHVR